MDLTRPLFDVLTVAILVFQMQAFVLKRDKQDKYITLPLVLPPLLLMYLVVAPELSSSQSLNLSPFDVQVLGYQAVAIVMAVLARLIKSELSLVCFWLACFLNMGSVGYLIYLFHFYSAA